MRPYLDPGEEIRLDARPHPVALAGPLARAAALGGPGAALVVAGTAAAWPLGALGAALLLVAALVAVVAVWRWDRTQVVLTSEKLLVVYGIVRRRAAAVRLARVGPIEVEQSLVGRALGYGTIVAGDVEVPYVPGRASELVASLTR